MTKPRKRRSGKPSSRRRKRRPARSRPQEAVGEPGLPAEEAAPPFDEPATPASPHAVPVEQPAGPTGVLEHDRDTCSLPDEKTTPASDLH